MFAILRVRSVVRGSADLPWFFQCLGLATVLGLLVQIALGSVIGLLLLEAAHVLAVDLPLLAIRRLPALVQEVVVLCHELVLRLSAAQEISVVDLGGDVLAVLSRRSL